MNIEKIQKILSEFAKEREWEQFHTPKNLTMALSVESSELVEIFQWLTPEQSSNLTDKQEVLVKEEIVKIMRYFRCRHRGINKR